MPRQENTKDLFIQESLRLFSEKGYERVTLQEIAKAVGCVPSALYKHYKNKQELYDAIIAKSIEGYNEYLIKNNQAMEKIVNSVDNVADYSIDKQVAAVQDMFLRAVHDEWVTNFRKLMIIEQFNMPELAEMYNVRYIDSKLDFFAKWISIMMDKGLIAKDDPEALAVAFSAPISILIGVVDRDPSKEQWALDIIDAHVRLFLRTYAV